MKKLYILFAFSLLAVSASAQLPSTSKAPHISWTAAAAGGGWTGCTVAAPCTYVVSRAVCTSTCPPATGTTYTPLNQASPTSNLFYDDLTATGTVGYVVQALQAGGTSVPSNIVLPTTVPVNPLPPILNQPTIQGQKGKGK